MRYVYDKETRTFHRQEMVERNGVEVRVPRVDAHYNHAFGKVVKNKFDLKDTVRSYNDSHGTDLIEMGNDPPRKNKEIDYRSKVDMREVLYHFNKGLRK